MHPMADAMHRQRVLVVLKRTDLCRQLQENASSRWCFAIFVVHCLARGALPFLTHSVTTHDVPPKQDVQNTRPWRRGCHSNDISRRIAATDEKIRRRHSNDGYLPWRRMHVKSEHYVIKAWN